MSNGPRWSTGLRLAACAAALCTGLVLSAASAANALPPPTSGQTDVWYGGPLVNPLGIAVDPLGDVFVADAGAGTVDEIALVSGVYQTPTPVASGFVTPTGLAMDPLGNLYVTDPGVTNGKVYMIPKTSPTTYGSPVGLPFGGADFTPSGVAVDLHQNVYVSDDESRPSCSCTPGNPHVLFLEKDRTSNTGYDSQQALPIGGLVDPQGVAVDAEGDVFVADSSTNHVIQLPKKGRGYGSQFDLPFGGLDGPTGVAVSPVRGLGTTIYVVDTGKNRVVEISSRLILGLTPQANAPFGGLSGPTYVTVGSDGTVYLTDSGNDRVRELPAGNVK